MVPETGEKICGMLTFSNNDAGEARKEDMRLGQNFIPARPGVQVFWVLLDPTNAFGMFQPAPGFDSAR